MDIGIIIFIVILAIGGVLIIGYKIRDKLAQEELEEERAGKADLEKELEEERAGKAVLKEELKEERAGRADLEKELKEERAEKADLEKELEEDQKLAREAQNTLNTIAKKGESYREVTEQKAEIKREIDNNT